LSINTSPFARMSLKALRDHPEWSYNQIAREAGWLDRDYQPERWKVQRAIETLAEGKLVGQPRKGARWPSPARAKKLSPRTTNERKHSRQCCSRRL
jgi:hypothetical protein